GTTSAAREKTQAVMSDRRRMSKPSESVRNYLPTLSAGPARISWVIRPRQFIRGVLVAVAITAAWLPEAHARPATSSSSGCHRDWPVVAHDAKGMRVRAALPVACAAETG